MPILTLTSDHGQGSFHIPAAKAYILKENKDCQIIDIAHNISPFNIEEAAFILRNCFRDFPAGSIHLISVQASKEYNEEYILVDYADQYFLAKNNGLISLITDGEANNIYRFFPEKNQYRLFPLKSILAKKALELMQGKKAEQIAEKTESMHITSTLKPLLEPEIIRGSVLHIDHYGNAISNISKSHIEHYRNFSSILISFDRRNNLDTISLYYDDVEEGEKLCLFGSTGLLEIAINKGNAAKLFAIEKGNTILIEFK
jgi:S-adenosyl-L-methionine hydrolase (adenosine-forming)